MEWEECEKQCLFSGTSQGIVSSKDRAVYVLDLAPVHAGCDCSMNHARGKKGGWKKKKDKGKWWCWVPNLPSKLIGCLIKTFHFN